VPHCYISLTIGDSRVLTVPRVVGLLVLRNDKLELSREQGHWLQLQVVKKTNMVPRSEKGDGGEGKERAENTSKPAPILLYSYKKRQELQFSISVPKVEIKVI
jgi:hypothetical protein